VREGIDQQIETFRVFVTRRSQYQWCRVRYADPDTGRVASFGRALAQAATVATTRNDIDPIPGVLEVSRHRVGNCHRDSVHPSRSARSGRVERLCRTYLPM
jgi:hypothetical protein